MQLIPSSPNYTYSLPFFTRSGITFRTKETQMDLKGLTDVFECRAAGTLFWTAAPDGSVWILLARRTMNTLLGRAYTYTIPTVAATEGESLESAAARAAHDEMGLMPSTSSFEEFWHVSEGKLEMSLYSQRLSSMKKPKCRGSYADACWVVLPDDFIIEDADSLLRDELKAFAKALQENRKVC